MRLFKSMGFTPLGGGNKSFRKEELNMRRISGGTILLLVGLLLVAFGNVAPAQVSSPDWWKKVAEPYKGTVLHGVTESTPPSKYIIEKAIPEFEQLTGIKVEIEATSWDEMYNKEVQALLAGSSEYDLFYIEQDFVSTFIEKGWLTNLSTFIQNENLTEPNFDLNDFTSFINYFKDKEGNIYAIPFEAFLKSYTYRKDLFEDPEIQATFKAEFGYDLQVPKNWDQYTDIAKFFTEYGKKKGIELYGHLAEAKTHPALAWDFTINIFPAWGIFNFGINPENLRAKVENGGTLNSDQAKKALRWYINMLQYAPPGARTYTWDEAAGAFAAGKVAQGFLYLENLGWIATDPTRSNVVGKVSVALSPTAPGVLDLAKQGKGYIGYMDGAGFGIPYSSKNKEAAWLFIQWCSRKEWQLDFAKATARVVRKSTFDELLKEKLDPAMADYFNLLRDYGYLYAGTPSYPFIQPLIDVYLKWLSKAVAGEVPPEEALDNLAAEVEERIGELGYYR
jgi:multiple sugar transport system substrate-binding protein